MKFWGHEILGSKFWGQNSGVKILGSGLVSYAGVIRSRREVIAHLRRIEIRMKQSHHVAEFRKLLMAFARLMD